VISRVCFRISRIWLCVGESESASRELPRLLQSLLQDLQNRILRWGICASFLGAGVASPDAAPESPEPGSALGNCFSIPRAAKTSPNAAPESPESGLASAELRRYSGSRSKFYGCCSKISRVWSGICGAMPASRELRQILQTLIQNLWSCDEFLGAATTSPDAALDSPEYGPASAELRRHPGSWDRFFRVMPLLPMMPGHHHHERPADPRMARLLQDRVEKGGPEIDLQP